MGTNYYYRDGRHVAKTSAIGEGRYQVIWAIDPDIMKPADLVDEYGGDVSEARFEAIITNAAHWDRSSIGTEFS